MRPSFRGGLIDHRAVITVLIVEDEPLVRQIAAEEFEEAGFLVVSAEDGDKAVDLLSGDCAINLLFTDIRLPGGMDGWAIADAARRLRPAIPVIYATGFTSDGVSMVEGAVFFKKPYRLAAVIAAAAGLGVGP